MTYYIVGALVALWIVGGISRHIRGRGKIIRVISDNCTGCGKCLKRCSHHVFEMVKDGNGAHITVKNPDKCTACGDCVIFCKFSALETVNKNKPS
ncbi:MAG: 4Fe-4S dicluster domain-containing protein [Dysgonamonadaceae bacterium]|jgi:NAD-dependent dihydropyrimidine dehydrogenase PreA subunit|nr:4Fe-4S dicluster domain-containing protein [Dysgonamonadaceae bacterium]